MYMKIMLRAEHSKPGDVVKFDEKKSNVFLLILCEHTW